jgi:transposase
VERWTKSGQSAEEFAAREGLNKGRLVWWRWKLRTESSVPADAAPPSFLPVEVVEPKTPPVLRSALMEIVLPNGRVVRVAPGFDLVALAHVLTIAEQEQGRGC